MKTRLPAIVVFVLFLCGGQLAPLVPVACAVADEATLPPSEGVVVIANRSHGILTTELRTTLPSAVPFTIAPGDVVNLPWRKSATLVNLQTPTKTYQLDNYSLYVLTDDATLGWNCVQVQLAQPQDWILVKQLATPTAIPQTQALTSQTNITSPQQSVAPKATIERPKNVLRVEIYVDDNESTRQSVWEAKLRKRLAAASQLLDYHCNIKLEVVRARTWVSTNSITDFEKTLAEFEQLTTPGADADLCIGFTGQYEIANGRIHLGGTRGGLKKHILLRAHSKKMTEPEHLELLVHELGHYFGAAHSIENTTVMRPLVADKQANNKRFKIRYDPLNTLAMNIVAGEFQTRGVRQWSQLSIEARQRLLPIYAELNKLNPQDPAAIEFMLALGARPTKNLALPKP